MLTLKPVKCIGIFILSVFCKTFKLIWMQLSMVTHRILIETLNAVRILTYYFVYVVDSL